MTIKTACLDYHELLDALMLLDTAQPVCCGRCGQEVDLPVEIDQAQCALEELIARALGLLPAQVRGDVQQITKLWREFCQSYVHIRGCTRQELWQEYRDRHFEETVPA